VVNHKGPILNLPEGYHHSWAVQILPYLERGSVYRHFDFREGVYEPSNQTARATSIGSFLCPSNAFRSQNHYAGCHSDVEAPIDIGNHGVLYLNSHIRLDEISDGPAFTILLGEFVGGPGNLGWASGTRGTLRNTGSPINAKDPLSRPVGAPIGAPVNPNDPALYDAQIAELVDTGVLKVEYVGGFSSHHQGTANFLFCDGSVRNVKNAIDQRIFRALGNRADGTLISDDQF
jgi:prepilin-type processing-associated H-X9-DG protein